MLGCILLEMAVFGGAFLFAWHNTGSIDQALSTTGFFATVGFIGYLLFEAVEYIEHYGLVFDPSKDISEIREASSWNCEMNLFYNWLVFRVQRHSDHHLNAYKPFTALELRPKQPKLPCTLLEAAYIAPITPLWYYLIHPFLDEVMGQGKVSASHRLITDIIRNSLSNTFVGVCLYALYTM